MIRQALEDVHGKYKPTDTEKGETGEEQNQEHAHNFLSYQAVRSQMVRQIRKLL
jgi:hypothetical protein